MDPKPNQSISLYAVFANNPIWYSDVLGDTFLTKSDVKFANKISSLAQKKEMYYNDNIAALEAINSMNIIPKDGMDFFINEAKEGLKQMQDLQFEIAEMHNSPQLFTYKAADTETQSKTNAHMRIDGVIEIGYLNIANAIHETKHGFQHINCNVEMIPGGKARYVDMTDETEAYKRQYFFDPKSVTDLDADPREIKSSRDINNTWLRQVKDHMTGERIYKDHNPMKQDVPK